jgi:hypothetical protein
VHVRVLEAVRGEAIEVRRLAQSPVAAKLAIAGIVEHDEQDVGCALLGALRLGPCRLRLVDRAADPAAEGLTGLVLLEGHVRSFD